MDGTFLQELKNEITATNFTEAFGLQYNSRQLYPVLPPPITFVKCRTLSGFVDYIEMFNNDSESTFVHVVNECTVAWKRTLDFSTGRVDALAFSEYNPAPQSIYSSSGKNPIWVSSEQFIIEAQTRFQHNEDLGKVLSLVGNVRDEHIKNEADDGVTQIATVKEGISFQKKVEIPRFLKLVPYRTFPEVTQPSSQFLFRGRTGPQFSLTEDGSDLWKLEAVADISKYLHDHLSDIKNLQIIA